MISLIIIFCLSFLPNMIHTSVPFILNPDCDLVQCKEFGRPALYYANQLVGDNAIHIFYSSLDELTISICQTAKGVKPVFNYTALFSNHYINAIQFPDTAAYNSFSLVIRRLIQFDDINDDGFMNDDDNTTMYYFLNNLITTNITFQNNNTNQPRFELPFEMLNGSLTIDIIYPGESIRDKKFPKLHVESKSFFVNLALKVNNYSQPNTRFAFELYLLSPSIEGSALSSSKYIDDQFTPGIFTVWKMRTLSTLYPSSMLWKPVVYQSEERSIEQNTLMHTYPIKNNVTLDQYIDQGIFYSIISHPSASAFTVSLGQAKDGFFSKTNYTFIQFAAGLDLLEPDSTKEFVTIALIVSLALPGLVAIIALIVILKRRFSKQPASSYDVIEE